MSEKRLPEPPPLLNVSVKSLVGFCQALLNDDHGISEEAWLRLGWVMIRYPDLWDKISNAVEATDGRYYLPEGTNLLEEFKWTKSPQP